MKKVLLSLLGLLVPQTAYAAGTSTLTVPQPPGFNITDLGLLISNAIGVALIIAGILVFVFLVWGGIQWITSGGEKGKTEEARNKITSAVIGLIVLAASYALLMLMLRILGFDSLTSTLEGIKVIDTYSGTSM